MIRDTWLSLTRTPMASLYRVILKNAWLITKKHLYLWPLGFFVAFLGNGGEYQILSKQIKKVSLQPETLSSLKSWFLSWSPNLNLSIGRSFLLALSLVVALIILLFFIWLIISSVAALIQGFNKASQEERGTFSSLLLNGSRSFKPVFVLYLIAKVIVYGVLVLIITPLMITTFAQGNQSLNIFIIFLTFLIFIPLTIIVSFVTRYASAYVVLMGQKMWEAFKNGWRLFAANWLISLEMAFILLVINLLVSVVIFIVAFLLFSPFLFAGLVRTIEHPEAVWNFIFIPIILTIILTIIVGAGLATFQLGSWTLLFLRLTKGGKAYSKIVRWVATFPEKFKKSETK